MARQARQPWLDKLANRGSTSSLTVARQARQPWLDKLANRGSTGSPTGIGVAMFERRPIYRETAK
ncbi:hypothetical protein [Thermospira aquatica]|uniref:Uncharacterized protein n=1 Tax=Thermospira aquatica TaxID=2828656 RepID=A0AAX3BBR9_9SPIR|nr:hypothetical protein [Thermospira aquatica]URA09767.1 hypothetical protein KDW03_09810 [Thermospira aquatica]